MYSLEQRVFIVLEYYKLERSPTATKLCSQKRFNFPKTCNHAKVIGKLFDKFERTGSVSDNRMGNAGRTKTVVSPRNVINVSEILQQNPKNRFQKIASETVLKYSSTQKIL